MGHRLEPPLPWLPFLSEVDESLSKPIELHCLRGFILTALYGVPRSTGDLDYITAVPRNASAEVERLAGPDSKLARKYKVCIHRAGGVTDVPENYNERLTDLSLELRNLVLKVLEPYDLVLSKLTRNSPKDRADVKYLAAKLKLSFQTLTERFSTEMKSWVANPDRHEVTLTKVWQEYFSE